MDYSGMVARQRRFFESGESRSFCWRLDRLSDLANALERATPELLEALKTDMGKPEPEAFVTEIAFLQAEIRHAKRKLPSWGRREKPKLPLIALPGAGWVQAEPYGVCLIFGPWNYPVQLLLSPLVGCLAAGNCAVLKPSELAPATSKVLADIVSRTFSREVICLVEGGKEVAEALLKQRFDKIFFTGSTAVGKRVMAAAANHLTPVTLELGGKSPCIVCKDATLETAARRIMWGKFLNAGQTCVAPDFVCVHRSIVDAFKEACLRVLQEFYGNNPKDSPDFARIVNRQHVERLERLLRQGNMVTGGEVDAEQCYIAPTILEIPDWDSPVMEEEIFGPILPLIVFEDLDEVVRRLQFQETPLALYLFTNDRAVQEMLLSRLRSGGVCMNDTVSQIICHDLPFGGLGSSGMGQYRGKAGFDAFSHPRSVLRRSIMFDAKMRYPPYRTPLKTLSRAMRFLSGG